MSEAATKTDQRTYLSEYKPSPYLVDDVKLHFDVQDISHVTATSNMHYSRNTETGAEDPQGKLVLNGCKDPKKDEFFKLQSILLNGTALAEGADFEVDKETGNLTIFNMPDEADIEIVTEINPDANKSNSGLYASEGALCTQCESEGFRNITYSLDRPDVLSTYDVTIEADKAQFPYLLSNPGEKHEADLGNGRHQVRWIDKRPKPCYLFALAGGDYDVVRGEYTYPKEAGGQTVHLEYYVNKGDAHKADFALDCLKQALQHEYDRWGHVYHSLPYGGDLFMTVATNAFNMGAMENTGLNFFNSKYVLADPKTATDMNHFMVDSVINHEWCHDETGNWIIPNSWFQIALKEGLTVFRDQTYTGDEYDAAIQRIEDVQELRGRVFSEDAGANVHPMILSSYTDPSSNYDSLTYPKGAMVNRMVQGLIGVQGYKDAYRAFHDVEGPSTATINDYFEFIGKHSGKDLSQFVETWTTQAGTPTLEVYGSYNLSAQTYTLKVKQHIPQTADNPDQKKKPFHLPFKVGLVGPDGKDMPLKAKGDSFEIGEGGMLEITEEEQTFVFEGVNKRPRMSLNRDMSAYAKIAYTKGSEPSFDDLVFLAANDSNGFKRWDTLQEIGIMVMQQVLADKKAGKEPSIDPRFIQAIESVLDDPNVGDHLKAKLLLLPSASYLENLQPKGTVDPVLIKETRDFVREAIAENMQDKFLQTYQAKQSDAPYVFNKEEMGRRSLMNVCLGYLGSCKGKDYTDVAKAQFDAQHNFNDIMSSVAVLANADNQQAKDDAFAKMYDVYKDDKLVMDSWFSVQAASDQATPQSVEALSKNEKFDATNPNKLRSLVGGFMASKAFHKEDGSGYRYISEWIAKIDEFNTEVSIRIAKMMFDTAANYAPKYQDALYEQIDYIRQLRGDKITKALSSILDKAEETISKAREERPHACVSGEGCEHGTCGKDERQVG